MSKGVITKVANLKVIKARSGNISLPKIVQMAFGDDGVDSDGNPIAPSCEQTSLKNEILRKPIDGYSFPKEGSCKYSCRLEKDELTGAYINEIGLIDEEGDLIAVKTFTSKPKTQNNVMVFEMDDKFEEVDTNG